MNSRPCSDPRLVPGARRLVVLEGMPGAGKTTALTALEQTGSLVVGEYTRDDGTTITVASHPGTSDDDAHQANWPRKAAMCTQLLRAGRVVYADRDWVSSLAYAYSVSAGSTSELLRERAQWAARCLAESRLLLPARYLVFDLDPQTSLTRRAATLRAGHPWTTLAALERLRDFYRDPARALSPVSPELAALMSSREWLHIDGHHAPQQLLQYALTAGTGP